MKSNETRLQKLEQHAEPPGVQILAYCNHWNPDAEGIVGDAAIAATHAALGANDELLLVEFVEDWRGAEDDDILE